MNTSLDRYEQAIQASRERFASNFAASYAEAARDAETLERYLIQYCALGVKMTQSVEDWIRRAGERCGALGFTEIGQALLLHARHEAGHEKLFAADARSLAERRARAGRSRVDVESLLSCPLTPGIEQYVRLHEDTIASESPYAQIAIEYEIERLSLSHGAGFIQRCIEMLGSDVYDCLSFLRDHVALDAGHTQFNARQLQRLLDEHPEFLEPLVHAGGAALDAYAAFLDDCGRDVMTHSAVRSRDERARGRVQQLQR